MLGLAIVIVQCPAASTIYKEHLLQNYFAESNENLSLASLWWGTQMIHNRILILSFVSVAMANERKEPKKILKNLLQNYWPDSFETLKEASV